MAFQLRAALMLTKPTPVEVDDGPGIKTDLDEQMRRILRTT